MASLTIIHADAFGSLFILRINARSNVNCIHHHDGIGSLWIGSKQVI